VEESAAAAQSLEHQSAQLVAAVAIFKLSGDQHRSAMAPVRKPAPRPQSMTPSVAPSSLKSASKTPNLALAQPTSTAATNPSKIRATASGNDDWESF